MHYAELMVRPGDSGFDRDDEWGYRAMEPSRCCISSIALVLLKTGIMHHPPGPTGERQVTIDYNQMTTAQKLLLFWRKPAVSHIVCLASLGTHCRTAQVLVGRYRGRGPFSYRPEHEDSHKTMVTASMDAGVKSGEQSGQRGLFMNVH